MAGRRVCVWCTPEHDLGPAEGIPDGQTTHGMCPAAEARVDEQIREIVVRPPCSACHMSPWHPKPPAWIVCLARASGGPVHEGFSYGPGSVFDEPRAEVAARTWAATQRQHTYPGSLVLGIYRDGPAGAERVEDAGVRSGGRRR